MTYTAKLTGWRMSVTIFVVTFFIAVGVLDSVHFVLRFLRFA